MENYCSTCAKSFSRPQEFQRHLSTATHLRKRRISASTPIVVKKIKLQQPPASNDFNIRLIHRGLSGVFKIYRAQIKRICNDFLLISTLLMSHLLYLLERAVMDTNGIKAQLRCSATFRKEAERSDQQTARTEKTAWFASKQKICLHSTKVEEQYAKAMAEIAKQIEEFVQNGSGWTVKKIDYLDLYVSKYSPIRGTTYTKLPPYLASKKAILNVKNNDEKCFMWSILAALNPVTKNAERVSKYAAFTKDLNFEGISFPVSLDSISQFEEQNNLAVNVFGFGEGLYPLYTTANRSKAPINLLLMTPTDKPAHYCLIKDLDRLLFRETKHESRKSVCPYCLCAFNSHLRLKKHQEFCTVDRQRIEMPEDPILRFRNTHRQLRAPYVMYADFECFVKPTAEGTTKTHQHIPNSYCVLGVNQCCAEPKFDEPNLYRGESPVKHFLETVIGKGENFVGKQPLPLKMKAEDQERFNSSTHCSICNEQLHAKRVRDHCHQCGKFRGAAHSSCNTKLYESRDVTVFFHNLRRYDGHLIMQEIGSIAKEKGLSLECVPKGMEDYISFYINLKTKGRRWRLRFGDSLAFLNAPLETLVSTLPDDQFTALHKFCDHPDLLKRKGSYPYEFMDGPDKFNLTELPTAQSFYNTLKQEPISHADYNHTERVWKTHQFKHMGAYHDLYLLTDVLLLTDVFQSFRGFSMNSFGLDPSHYITLPSFAWDALLKFTGVKLELLQDPDMYHFFSAGIKGGVSVISHRYAKANHPELPGHEPSKPNSFIMYLDANNLYGWAMKRALPVGGFEWMGPREKLPPKEPGVGYVWEVDLDYPEDIHDQHDYPMAPERMKISEISPYCQSLKCKLNLPEISTEKLVPNLLPKRNYIVHHENLDLYLAKGLDLKKIHRGIKVREEAWMAPYIDFNTEMRKQASSKFDKDLFKLFNNAVFGKSMENVFNYMDVRLVTNSKKYEKLVANPLYRQSQPFNEDLTAVLMAREKAVLSKPIYTGFSVLDISKTLMYRFHYDYMAKNPDFRCKLLFTDTVSLCYEIEANNVYETILKDRDNWFDTSDFPQSHPLHSDLNKKVMGMMKDELCGTPILEFIGLRAKMYSIKTVDAEHIRAKDTLFNQNLMRHTMRGFRSEDHEIYTVTTNKITLSAYDDKRFVLPDGVSTLAYGHKRIKEENLMSASTLHC